MYNATPFEGVKVIDDYDHQYFVSLVNLEKGKYPSASTMTRVAQVKAQQQANTFFNGSFIASDFIIKTTEAKSKESTSTIIETMESIKENSLGFVKGMELLTNFEVEEAKRMVFIYYKEIEKTK
jgi:6-pyruvoyl-tetrahydropterin synthase